MAIDQILNQLKTKYDIRSGAQILYDVIYTYLMQWLQNIQSRCRLRSDGALLIFFTVKKYGAPLCGYRFRLHITRSLYVRFFRKLLNRAAINYNFIVDWFLRVMILLLVISYVLALP